MIRGALIAIGGTCAFGERRGVAVRLEDDGGHVGWGEASPLPCYSPDCLSDCAGALSRVLSRPLPESPDELDAAIAGISAALPAARFALESALLGLYARQRGIRLADLLGEPAGWRRPHSRQRVRRTALLPADLGEKLAAGVRSFKLKVGRPGLFCEELARLAELRRRLPKDAAIRVDANAAWDADTARKNIDAMRRFDLELVEQPTPTAELSGLGPTAVPLALDESVRDELSDAILSSVSVFVLKPAVLGGLRRCVDIARNARARGIDSIVSHLLDGPIALSACIELALAIGGPRAHGLDFHSTLPAFCSAPNPAKTTR